MRKALALLLALVLLCLVVIIGAHAGINTERDQVAITENVVYGDKLAACGLNIVRNAQWDYRLHWSTDYNISAENAYSTEFEFTQSEERGEYKGTYTPSGVNFSNYVNGGIGSSHELTREDISGIFGGFEDLCLDVIDRAPAGERYTETVKISDYYDYYPMDIFLDLPNLYFLYTDELGNRFVRNMDGNDCEEVNDALRAYFRIPVAEDDSVEIEVYKNAGGAATEIYVNTLIPGMGYQILSAVSEYAVYFTFDSGTAVDFSEIPGGYGVYCLPFGATFEHQGGVYPTADVDGLKMVYPLAEDVKIEAFFISKDEERLIMVTAEDGMHILTAIELDTMETLQRIEIIPVINSEGGVHPVTAYEGFLVLEMEGARIATLDILENGDYSPNFVVDRMPNEDNLFWYRADCVYAYDGERLAIGWDMEQDTPPYDNCGFSVAVYDKNGLQYYGEYESGLMTGLETGDYGYLCQPTMYDGLLLEWK